MRAWLIAALIALVGTPALAENAAWWNKDWAYRKFITVDGSAKGANITQPIGREPLVIRLHDGNFVFKDALENGADVRFIGPDGKTPLAFHIESYDAASSLATIWVDFPEIPVGSTRGLTLYYGNKQAPPGENSGQTFDADYGLVYHFEATPGTPPRDRTANGSNGLTAASGVETAGIAGAAARFNGASGIKIPANGALNTTAGSKFTFSSWVKPDAVRPEAILYSRKDEGSSLVIGLSNGAPFVEVNGARMLASSALTAAKWNHLAVTNDGSTMVVYVNGVAAGTGSVGIPALATEARLGAEAEAAGRPGFVGVLDEVRLSKTARSAALIANEVATQGSESKLIAFGDDEKQSGAGFGIIGIIFKNVDHISWVVIGITALLGVLSWWVMTTKTSYAARAEKADDRFLDSFRSHIENPLALAQNKPGQAREPGLENSPIYRLYCAGADEILLRVQRGEHELSGEAQNVVRALMDAKFVRENQKLSSNLVWLTLAISGAPFLGLLGTVVGVMFTFAAIAAAGDVNINAIAPGISAALLATVTGMFVAIPALFGYNYILLRNKDITANMQVFVDEFITRVAEAFSRGTVHPAE